MALFNSALLLLGEAPEYLAQVLTEASAKALAAAFGIEISWYLHSHLLWLKLSHSSIRDLLLVCLAAHDLEFPGWTSANVKLLLPPRQRRGASP
jgi:hypothetical protein